MCLHAQGNKWTCPEGDAVAVCQTLDEAQLGNLTCADRTGLANSATSRHAVLDMLSITHGSDCPALGEVRPSLLPSHLFQIDGTIAEAITKAPRPITVMADLCPSLKGTITHAFLKPMSACAGAAGGHLWREGEWAHAARWVMSLCGDSAGHGCVADDTQCADAVPCDASLPVQHCVAFIDVVLLGVIIPAQ